MDHCPSCGGLLGRDCWNPQECAEITAQMARQDCSCTASGAAHLAIQNLRTVQRQLDMDGVEVGVSRQAVEETLALVDDLLTALRLAEPFIAGFEGDELQDGIDERLATVRAAIARAEGRA